MITREDIVYISGPMTGIPAFNYPAFHALEKELKNTFGCKVLNPASNFFGSTHLPRQIYMEKDLQMILEASVMIFLPGWRNSKGAKLEAMIAEELKLPMFDHFFNELEDETICQEADRIVGGDRHSDYGHPIEDFTRTGKLWGAILGIQEIDPHKVALMMVGLKLSREVHKPKRDNLVDGCGYLKTAHMVLEKQGIV